MQTECMSGAQMHTWQNSPGSLEFSDSPAGGVRPLSPPRRLAPPLPFRPLLVLTHAHAHTGNIPERHKHILFHGFCGSGKWVCPHKFLWLKVSHDAAVRVLGGAAFSSEASIWGACDSRLTQQAHLSGFCHHRLLDQELKFPIGYRQEVSLISLSYIIFYMAAHNMAAVFYQYE